MQRRQAPTSTRRHASGAALLVAAVLSAAPAAGLAPGDLRVPVLVGGHPRFQACEEAGIVRGPPHRRTDYVTVHAGPATTYAVLDRLTNGQRVHVCAARSGFVGVVYARRGEDCGVVRPRPVLAPYAGPCRAGWVFEAWIRSAP